MICQQKLENLTELCMLDESLKFVLKKALNCQLEARDESSRGEVCFREIKYVIRTLITQSSKN